MENEIIETNLLNRQQEHVKEQLENFNINMKELCDKYNNPYIEFFLYDVLRDFEKYCQSDEVCEYNIGPMYYVTPKNTL